MKLLSVEGALASTHTETHSQARSRCRPRGLWASCLWRAVRALGVCSGEPATLTLLLGDGPCCLPGLTVRLGEARQSLLDPRGNASVISCFLAA